MIHEIFMLLMHCTYVQTRHACLSEIDVDNELYFNYMKIVHSVQNR